MDLLHDLGLDGPDQDFRWFTTGPFGARSAEDQELIAKGLQSRVMRTATAVVRNDDSLFTFRRQAASSRKRQQGQVGGASGASTAQQPKNSGQTTVHAQVYDEINGIPAEDKAKLKDVDSGKMRQLKVHLMSKKRPADFDAKFAAARRVWDAKGTLDHHVEKFIRNNGEEEWQLK